MRLRFAAHFLKGGHEVIRELRVYLPFGPRGSLADVQRLVEETGGQGRDLNDDS